jgi:DNA-binding NarL/FixJ family response regulator
MNPRTKIFVVEQDCGRLINIMLYLEQFAEFELVGSCGSACELNWQLQQANVDVVLVDSESLDAESIATIRAIKAGANAPSMLVLGGSDVSAAEKVLLAEADGLMKLTSGIKDLAESIRRVLNKRKAVATVAKLPRTKAG